MWETFFSVSFAQFRLVCKTLRATPILVLVTEVPWVWGMWHLWQEERGVSGCVRGWEGLRGLRGLGGWGRSDYMYSAEEEEEGEASATLLWSRSAPVHPVTSSEHNSTDSWAVSKWSEQFEGQPLLGNQFKPLVGNQSNVRSSKEEHRGRLHLWKDPWAEKFLRFQKWTNILRIFFLSNSILVKRKWKNCTCLRTPMCS